MEQALHAAWMWLSGITPERWGAALTAVAGFFFRFVWPAMQARKAQQLKAQALEYEKMAEREQEEQDAAKAFTADARAVLEEANRNMAEELRTAHEDLQRALRGQMAAEKKAAAVEEMAKSAIEEKDAEIARIVELTAFREPRTDPPDVIEEDDTPTIPPGPLALPPIKGRFPLPGKKPSP